MKKGTSKSDGMKVTYHYVEPKTPEEKAEQERRIHDAYSILFEHVLQSEKWKRYKAGKKTKQ